jgi:Ca-activated chloride channel family protein
MPLPSPRPISGSRLAPKIKMMMNRMTISSGIPRPIQTPSTAGYALDSITFALVAALAVCSGVTLSGQFASGVSVVEVYASATNSLGEALTGLKEQDFEVFEDGKPQRISVFTAGDFPLSVAVALDRSFSMAGSRLAVAKSAARVFLGELRAEDEAAILAIGSEVETVAPLSANRAAQYEALARLDTFGTTGLYDAVIRAIDLTQAAKGRRALVLLSDGVDRYSKTTAGNALEQARRSDVIVYPIALASSPSSFFEQLAGLTGGRAFHVRDPAQLSTTLGKVADELRFQYLLGYVPPSAASSEKKEWHRIMVRVKRPGVVVRAREGYVAK